MFVLIKCGDNHHALMPVLLHNWIKILFQLGPFSAFVLNWLNHKKYPKIVRWIVPQNIKCEIKHILIPIKESVIEKGSRITLKKKILVCFNRINDKIVKLLYSYKLLTCLWYNLFNISISGISLKFILYFVFTFFTI